MSEPLLVLIECMACKHQWNGLFPDGLESDVRENARVECPNCHQEKGCPMDKENTVAMEHDDCGCLCHMNQDQHCHQCWDNHQPPAAP
jgi:hypothetical protein